MKTTYQNIDIRDEYVCNIGDHCNPNDYNPHNVRPFAIGNELGTLAVAFADCAQDALDIAVDAGKLDSQMVKPEDLANMSDEEQQELIYAGNASDPFYQDYLWIRELPNVALSFAASFAAAFPKEN